MCKAYIYLAFIFLVGGFEVSSQVSCAYKYRKRITINPSYVSGASDLKDFPMILSITGDNDLRVTGSGGHVQNANGYDIMFTTSDGVTQLNHQLSAYTASSGNLDCWIKIPELSTSINTYIYIYYGNSTISTDQSSTNTWSNGFVGVWHFDNDVDNSTATVWLDGTNNGTTNNTTAKIGTARRFQSASNQYIDVTPYNAAFNLFNEVTVSTWVRPSSIDVDQKIAGNEDDINGGWKFGVYADNKIEFEIRNSSNLPYLSRSATGGTALSNNTWYYAVGQYSNAGDFINTYLNGTLDRNYTTTVSCWSSNGTLKIGREPFASTGFLDGRLDELRISNVIRSADWIATEYNNQNSPGPGTFYTISAEPKVWLGTTNTNWNTATNWSGGIVPASMNDVIISNTTPSKQPVLNASPQVGALWLYSSTSLSLSTQSLSVAYDVLNCGTISGGTGYVILNSGASNIQSQYLSGSGTYSLNNLTINNTFASPAVVLNKDVNISGGLVLTSGIVYTSATNILALGTSATSTGGSANSFVSGPISKTGAANFIFPIGKGTRWRRAAMTNISASSTFRAEYFNTPYTNISVVNSPLNNVSALEYWQVDRTVGAGNANLSLYWEDASASGINNCPDLTIARWNGASWDERPGSTVGGSTCSATGGGNVLSNALITAFSPFTFASKSGGVNVLPVEMVNFKSACNEEGVKIEWETYTEKNNDHFTVERSTNGVDWTEIGRIAGAGTSSGVQAYSLIDSYGATEITYYRVKQVDKDGAAKISNLVTTYCVSEVDNNVSVFPNPANDKIGIEINVSGNYGKGALKIIDMMGRISFYKELDISQNTTKIEMPHNLAPGAYSVVFTSGQTVFPVRRLVVESF